MAHNLVTVRSVGYRSARKIFAAWLSPVARSLPLVSGLNVKLAEIENDRGDACLVAEAQRGDREAFGEIVARYQTLICSITYSRTGSLSRSEDLAQETFITAWRELGRLREPGKLREWLSGIARNLARNACRKDRSEPAERSESIEALAENAANEPSPTEAAITLEEQAILWRSLEQVPDIYREPMVLFYRENQNIRQVAAQLDLSEDAVKQRLARGRKLLSTEIERIVEGALRRSLPGRAFTLGIMAALPLLPVSAAAATAGAAAAKGSVTASSMSALGALAAIAGPLAGLAGAWIGVRASLKEAKSLRERQFIIKSVAWSSAGIVSFLLLLGGLLYGARNHWQTHGPQFAIAIAVLVVLYVGGLLAFVFGLNHRMRTIQREESAGATPAPASFERREYRSKATFLGWPLVHAASGREPDGRQAVARGWIAVGDVAIGAFAIGGTAMGGVAFGGAAVGLISLGGAAAGLLAFGGLGIGAFAVGGMAIGIEAAGGCAIALKTAFGGAALAVEHALGGMAWARHANDAAARAVIDQSSFFKSAKWMMEHSRYLVVLPFLLFFFPGFWSRKPSG